jgi:hypothetical protein
MIRRFRMIACEVTQREVCAAVARGRNVVDVDFLPKGLHDVGPERMSAQVQEAVDSRSPQGYEAILLWYGLCNNGLCGIRAPLPLILPRAHDCITLLLGSRDRYARYFDDNPGTYFQSPGWIERDTDPNDNPASVTARLNISRDVRRLAERYGEDNAEFLAATIADWFKYYRKLAFIDTGVGDVDAYRAWSTALAVEKHWEYEELQGSSGLLDRLLAGDWDVADFLTVPPGQTMRPSYRPDIIEGA